MNWMKRFVVAAISVLATQGGYAVNYSFTRIADNSDGAFTSFGDVVSVNASGTVAFSANGTNSTVGIYTSAGSSIHTVFQGSQSSYVMGFSPVINDGGAVAYLRSDFGSASHVIYDGGSGPTIVASGGGSFINVNEPRLNNGGTITFGASVPNGDFNLYTWSSGGGITPRYSSSVNSTFLGLSTVTSINDNGVLGFNGTLGSGGSQTNGLFYGTGGSFSTITLANSSTGFQVLSPFPTINNSGVVLFYGNSSGTMGFYSGNGGPLTTYADTTGAYANLHVNPGLSDGGVIAFKATTDNVLSNGPAGIFTGPNPAADHVVRIGDELSTGFYLTDISYNGAINAHGQLAFNYTVQSLDHLTTHSGIALATPDTSAPVLSNIRDVSVGGGSTNIGGMQATFGAITQDGRFSADFFRPDTTAALALRIGEAAANAVNFGLASPDYQVWQLEFSGAFTGNADLVFHYDDSGLLAPESSLVMRHFVNGGWESPTQNLDTVNNTITLSSGSFSPFVLSAIPEPSTLSLLGLILAGLMLRRRMRK